MGKTDEFKNNEIIFVFFVNDRWNLLEFQLYSGFKAFLHLVFLQHLPVKLYLFVSALLQLFLKGLIALSPHGLSVNFS